MNNNLTINVNPTRSKYGFVYSWVERLIYSGEYPPGSCLPAEVDIADELKVSRGTVRKAIAMLVDEGLCTRRRGSGTFVSPVPKRIHPAEGKAVIKVLVDVAREGTIIHPLHEEILRGISETIEDYGRVECSLVGKHYNDQKLRNWIEESSGIILLGHQQKELLEYVSSLDKSVISAGLRFAGHPISSVTVDNVAAGFIATRHLLEQGCQYPMFIGSEIESPEFLERTIGFRSALNEFQVKSSIENVVMVGSGPGNAVERFLSIYEKTPELDGVLCAKDILALEILTALKSISNCKGKIRVIGIDDLFFSSISSPSLSSVAQPGYDLGVRVANLILTHNFKNIIHEHVQPILKPRASTINGI